MLIYFFQYQFTLCYKWFLIWLGKYIISECAFKKTCLEKKNWNVPDQILTQCSTFAFNYKDLKYFHFLSKTLWFLMTLILEKKKSVKSFCFSLLLILHVLLIPLSASHKRIVSLHDFSHISRYSLCELHSLLDNCRFVSTVLDQYHFYNGGKLITKALVTTVIGLLFDCPFPAFHIVH